MGNKPPIVNLGRLELQRHGKGADFQADLGRIARTLGMRKIGCTLVELEPGKRAWPYHLHHGDEELFIVLSGQGSLRYDDEMYPICAGDLIFAPPGPGTAHQIVNTSSERLRYLALSSVVNPEVCFYPDSGKYGAYFGESIRSEGHFIAEQSSAVDYWDGEV